MSGLTEGETLWLRAMIAGADNVGSNPDALRTLIVDYRARQGTPMPTAAPTPIPSGEVLFGEVFWFDPDARGSLEQEAAVRQALTPELGSRLWRLLIRLRNKRVGQATKVQLRFVETSPNTLAHAGSFYINLSRLLAPAPISDLVRHEFGHVVEQNDLLSNEGRNWFATQTGGTFGSETFADAVRDWIKGTGWDGLTPHLVS